MSRFFGPACALLAEACHAYTADWFEPFTKYVTVDMYLHVYWAGDLRHEGSACRARLGVS